MKTLKQSGVLLFIFLFAGFFMACDREQDVDLKEDEVVRQDVYNQILNDEELFNEFIDQMRNSSRSMDWMMANRPMMRNMYSHRQVQTMMQQDPEVLDTLMQGMMSNMPRDTTRMHQRMRKNWFRMMERDTIMYRQMQERFQQRNGNNN
jgi:hypothetical protein